MDTAYYSTLGDVEMKPVPGKTLCIVFIITHFVLFWELWK